MLKIWTAVSMGQVVFLSISAWPPGKQWEVHHTPTENAIQKNPNL